MLIQIICDIDTNDIDTGNINANGASIYGAFSNLWYKCKSKMDTYIYVTIF